LFLFYSVSFIDVDHAIFSQAAAYFGLTVPLKGAAWYSEQQERTTMLISMLNDPVVWGSLLGIAMIVGLMAYYLWLVIHHMAE